MSSFDNSLNSNESENESLADDEIKKYVKDFQNKVEKKFKKSKINKNYKIRKYFKEEFSKTDSNNLSKSLESLLNLSVYDLKCQNFKTDLEEIRSNKNLNENESLVEILQKIGKLDKNYLENQIKKPDSLIFKILCSSLTNKIESMKDSNSKYSQISSLYMSNGSNNDFDILKKSKKNNKESNSINKQVEKNYKKFINNSNKPIKNNYLKKSYSKNDHINKNVKSINFTQKNKNYKNKYSENENFNMSSKYNNLKKSYKNNKIAINPNLAKFLPKDIKLIGSLNLKDDIKNPKSKKLKTKIAGNINQFNNSKDKKNDDKITLTKEELSALIYKNWDKKKGKVKKIKNNAVSIINNTKNVVTISNISKKKNN